MGWAVARPMGGRARKARCMPQVALATTLFLLIPQCAGERAVRPFWYDLIRISTRLVSAGPVIGPVVVRIEHTTLHQGT